jgi:hypothetical protein
VSVAGRAVAALICGALAVISQPHVEACTAFCAVGAAGQVLVGNNEDWFNPRSKLWFIAAKPGAYGRMTDAVLQRLRPDVADDDPVLLP